MNWSKKWTQQTQLGLRFPNKEQLLVNMSNLVEFLGKQWLGLVLQVTRIGFLLQYSLEFGWSPRSFPDGATKLSNLVGLLRGKALAWAKEHFSFHPISPLPCDEFLRELKKTFAHPVSEGSVANVATPTYRPPSPDTTTRHNTLQPVTFPTNFSFPLLPSAWSWGIVSLLWFVFNIVRSLP